MGFGIAKDVFFVNINIFQQIKLKESQRAKAEMTRDHAAEKKLGMLSSLPEMCRIIRMYPYTILLTHVILLSSLILILACLWQKRKLLFL